MTGRVGLMLMAAALPQAAPLPSGKPITERPLIWQCSNHLSPVARTGMLDVTKTFRDDGTVADRGVRFYGEASEILSSRAPGDRAGVSITWPPWRSEMQGRPFDWGDGSFRASYYPQNVNVFARDRRARWRQTLVDNDGSLSVAIEGRTRYLVVPPGALSLTTEMTDGTAPVEFSLGQLFAWGAGRSTLHMYDTAVELSRGRGSTPVRRRRIVVDYTVDLARLRADIAAIRLATEKWEASLGNWRTRCPSSPIVLPGDIVVTQSR